MSQPGLNTNQGPVSRNFNQFADSESCLIFVMCAFKFKVSVFFDEIQKNGRQTRPLVLNKNF